MNGSPVEVSWEITGRKASCRLFGWSRRSENHAMWNSSNNPPGIRGGGRAFLPSEGAVIL